MNNANAMTDGISTICTNCTAQDYGRALMECHDLTMDQYLSNAHRGGFVPVVAVGCCTECGSEV